jgi:hypothetical protein
MRLLHPISALATVLLVAAPQAIAADAPSKPLRYGWKAGESYVYSVHIEMEGENAVATMQGNSTYTVKAASEDGFTLIHRGRLIPQVRTKEGRPDPLATIPLLHFSPFSGVGFGMTGFFPDQTELKIDALGNVQTTTGSSQLPMLGNLSRLVLEPLPEEPRATWEVALAATITEVEESRFPGPGPRFGPFGPRFGSSPAKTYQAQGRTVYTLGKPEGDTVPIAKTYELKTAEMVDGMPSRQMVGKGTITFDTKAGVPRALDFTATVTENTANTTVRVPMKVSYKLLEGAEREKALAPLAASTAGSGARANSSSTSTSTVTKDGKTITTVVKTTDDGRTVTTETTTTTVGDGKTTTTQDVQRHSSTSSGTASASASTSATAVRRNPASDADVDQILAGLASPDEPRRRSAAARLPVLEPNDRRAEVARALTTLLRDGDDFSRQAAARALGNWGTKQSVPALIKAVDDDNFAVRWAAIEALGQLKDKRAAGPIAAHLKADAIKAVPALRALGAAAESAVLDVLNEGREWSVRAEACRVLGAIGTSKSVPDLDRIAREDSGPLGLAAKQALRDIAARP